MKLHHCSLSTEKPELKPGGFQTKPMTQASPVSEATERKTQREGEIERDRERWGGEGKRKTERKQTREGCSLAGSSRAEKWKTPCCRHL